MADDRWNSYKEIFPIIIDDRSVGSIQLFPMIDYEISADSQHHSKPFCPFCPVSLSIIIHVMNDRNNMSSNLDYFIFIFDTLKTYDAGLFFTMAKDHDEGNLKVFITSEDGIKVSDPNW